MLVGEPAPAGLHALAVDGLVHKAGVELQRLLGGAVHGTELRANDAVQRVRQLLKAPVCQVPARDKRRMSISSAPQCCRQSQDVRYSYARGAQCRPLVRRFDWAHPDILQETGGFQILQQTE